MELQTPHLLNVVGESIKETEEYSGFVLCSDFKTYLYFILKRRLGELKNER